MDSKGKSDAVIEKDKRRNALEEAFFRIKQMLYLNELAPGQKIIYSDLAKRLNISATPVIQALNRLEASKIVKYIPNRGYFVEVITETEARNLYQAREALEVFSIPAIIENLDSKSLDSINDTFKSYKDAISDGNRRELVLLDCKFHLKLCEFSKNDVIYRILKDIFEQIYLKYRAEYLRDERVRDVIKEHRAILDSLRRADIGDSVRIFRDHIRRGMHYVIESVVRKNDRRIDDIFLTTA